MIEFYPTAKARKGMLKLPIVRNNAIIDVTSKRYSLNIMSRWRHELKIKNVAQDDAGYYHVDCGRRTGITNTAWLSIAGQC